MPRRVGRACRTAPVVISVVLPALRPEVAAGDLLGDDLEPPVATLGRPAVRPEVPQVPGPGIRAVGYVAPVTVDAHAPPRPALAVDAVDFEGDLTQRRLGEDRA